MPGLTERCVGISEYLSPQNSFPRLKGIIKVRYGDFLVNEIDTSGTVCRISDFGPSVSWENLHAIPKKEKIAKDQENCLSSEPLVAIDMSSADAVEPFICDPGNDKSSYSAASVDASDSGEKPNTVVVSQEMKATFFDFFNKEFPSQADILAEKLVTLLTTRSVDGNDHMHLPGIDDKNARTQVHKFFKEVSSNFSDVLVTDTINKTEIRVTYRFVNSRKRKQVFDDRNHIDGQTTRLGNYITCLMYKENKDTMECISRIASALRISAKAISYAGTKDRRGVTVQRIAISTRGGITIERLSKLNKFLGVHQKIFLGNFKYSNDSLDLGALDGNRFDIILRQVEPLNSSGNVEEGYELPCEDFAAALSKQLSTAGFINYFGMQRFGQSLTVPTYRVGQAILKGNFTEVISLIMDPREGEADAIESARVMWKMTKEYKKCLDEIPRRWVAERAILSYFASPGVSANDCLGAFQRIPHELRLMYLHSFQSLIWNTVASHRLSALGKSPIIGDFVISNASLPSVDPFENTVEEDDGLSGNSKFANIIELKTQEDCAQYSLADVVLPLPGYLVKYPPPLVSFYKELIMSYGIPFEGFGAKGQHSSITLAGSYRKLLCVPKDVHVEFLKYSDEKQDILETDIDDMRKKVELQPETDPCPSNGILSHGEASLLALRLQFSLPSSAYATMMIREFLRIDTGAAYQRSLCSVE